VEIRLEESAEYEVRADPDRLVQVVTNLLSNAIKVSPRGAEVAVSIRPRNGNIRISVRDHGAGIPESFRPRVFEKFAQAEASDARQKVGTGLGLSIVKQIVLRHGGEAGFTDAPGGGTIFYVELPGLQCGGHADAERKDNFDGARILPCEDDIDLEETESA